MSTREIPNRDQLVDYGHAVAGHAGVLSDADGELFIKPCTQTELDFYQSAADKFAEFTEIMPLFMGSLSLTDPAEVSSAEEDLPPVGAAINLVPDHEEKPLPATAAEPAAANTAAVDGAAVPGAAVVDCTTWKPNKNKRIKTEQAIVLENCTHGYKKPNILDAKLGVRLWADDAPLQKRQRFDIISAETTHRDYGCRIAGMRVYKGAENPMELDEDEYKIYDRDYGRISVNNDNFVDAVRKFVFNESAGIDKALGKAVCKGFAQDLERVEEVLEKHESRMYSASILFIYEGDGEALEDAIEQNNSLAERIEKSDIKPLRIDSGIAMEADSDGEEGSVSFPKVYTVKLIDFAHAKWVPGEGPDENTLTGVRSLRRIFEELAI
ncbi:hypothetical protein jhhlp_003746 [Lomentospora prolificans]|uniref:Kinase n=1 Tax=Lomentospora prolificans TaxID=41688 RepID=A0A2N3N9T4_9PEZI|nr:hypothetical protein jhhlp_003746 [Lomentospora prolificans]